jgi:adenylate kinase
VYKERGLVIEVDALGAVDDVSARVSDALAERGLAPVAQ